MCSRKVINDYACIGKGDFLDLMNASLGKYNPFCREGEDPKPIKAGSALLGVQITLVGLAAFGVMATGIL